MQSGIRGSLRALFLLTPWLALCGAAGAPLPVGAAAGDLVLRLPFDHFAGKTTVDASPSHSYVTVSAALKVKGVSGTALDFALPGAAVTCLDSRPLELSKALTLAAWVKIHGNDPGQWGTVIRKDGAYALRFGNGHLGLLLWTGEKVNRLTGTADQWTPDRWYYVVGTFDGKQMRLFVNGKEDPNSPMPLSGAVTRSGAPCCIGSVRGESALNGAIDEVRIYRVALTPAQVRASYAAGLKALTAQAGLIVKPEKVGGGFQTFRKPPRKITMVKDGFLWIDAEDFADYGGWTLDTQFVQFMGSAYLLAAGVGTPVADATTTFTIPRAGTYRVWVRARNWVKKYSPGTFLVLVNGQPLENVLGAADSSKWIWQRAGDVALSRGPVKLALHDLTGYYGRCDALILTTDLKYVPPNGREGVCRERARLTGLTLVPKFSGNFDVIVVGAGAAGCCAAIASARMGAKTALIQDRPVLGGNSSSECGVGLNGAASGHPDARETGIVEQVVRLRARYGFRQYSEAYKMLTDKEPNLKVFLNQRVFDAIMKDDKTIAGVRAVDTLTGAITEYHGKEFIDCTGDGWLGYFAKADFRIGREARDEFHEALAPKKPDHITMSGCLMGGNALAFRARSVGHPVAFKRPPWARKITTLAGFGRHIRGITGGDWWMEHPGNVDNLWHGEEARDDLIKISFSYWDFIKNRSSLKNRARDYVLSYIPIMNAKRESRRLMGDYILNENDCEQGRVFPDRISYGGWPLDVHNPEGIFSGKQGSFYCDKHVPIYTIPYRCLYSRNIANLLFAGRCVSVTHIALGSVRVQSTLATLGQAAGTAAAMCVAKGTTPRGIYRNHMSELQQVLLKNDQTIPGIPNEDPADLARKATITASSTASYVRFGKANVTPGDVHPLNCGRGMIFPTGSMKQLSRIAVLVASLNKDPTPLTLHLRAAAAKDDMSAAKDLATVQATVPAGTQGWVDFHLDLPVKSPYLWFWLSPADGLSWRLMTNAPQGCSRFYGNGETNTWKRRPGEYYAFYTVPAVSVPTTFAPGNVIDGYTRQVGDQTNMWASAPDQDMPQWIQVNLPKPAVVDTVYLTFDTNLRPRLGGPAFPPECVRDYTLSVFRNGKWQTVATVTDNFQRWRVHRFPAVETDRIRLTVSATNGDKSARVFGIRVYNE